MERYSLFEELRFIERSESEVNGAWKGAHLLLFFLAFVFGSFCTFCFHMLMYLFDEKCVLFPKLLSLTSLRHNVIYEFIPEDKDMLPVDFLSTQWVEKSACYLPTYVPLVSGIFGLVWTTMFLMCSTGSRSLTGLQRPWRVIPPVFLFSLAMSALCIYSSSVTHYGLLDLCIKLGEITGSPTCSYTVNVATLAYERKIRGVYQATRLTITSAWLHTGCWLASAVLALARILLAVDFRLVKIRAELVGDIDKMLERHEEQVRTVSPSHWNDEEKNPSSSTTSTTQIFFRNEDLIQRRASGSDILFISKIPTHTSALSLVPEERNKLARIEAYLLVRKDEQFIVNLLYDLLDAVDYTAEGTHWTLSSDEPDLSTIARQYGRQLISSKMKNLNSLETYEPVNSEEAEGIHQEIMTKLEKSRQKQLTRTRDDTAATPSTPKKKGQIAFESALNITSEMNLALKEKLDSDLARPEKIRLVTIDQEMDDQPDKQKAKSNLKSDVKNVGVQTEKKKSTQKHRQKVTIAESKSTYIDGTDKSSSESSNKTDETPVKSEKEKKD